MKRISILTLFIILYTQIFAQKNEIGVFAGGMFYRGEVSDFSWKSPGGLGGIMFRQNWNRAFSTQLTFSRGNVKGADRNSVGAIAQQRNFEFTTRITELSGQLVYNFYDFGHFAETHPWTPYLFGGIAGFVMSPQNSQDNNAPYSTLQLAIPFGVGAKFMVNENWNISLQFGARKTFTDYLDDVYVTGTRDPKLFAGNPNDKDMYFNASIGISYVFQSRPCPSFYKIRY